MLERDRKHASLKGDPQGEGQEERQENNVGYHEEEDKNINRAERAAE
jgi:hypothetical protein